MTIILLAALLAQVSFENQSSASVEVTHWHGQYKTSPCNNGSGTAITRELVVTAAHVLLPKGGPITVTVTAPGGAITDYGATLLAKDTAKDVAVLKTYPLPVIPIPLYTGNLSYSAGITDHCKSYGYAPKCLWSKEHIRVLTDQSDGPLWLSSKVMPCSGDSGGGVTQMIGDKEYLIGVVQGWSANAKGTRFVRCTHVADIYKLLRWKQ